MNERAVLEEVLDKYKVSKDGDRVSTTAIVNKIIKAFEMARAKDRDRAAEADRDRYDEPPGTWKSVKGFVGPGGWTS